MSNLHDKLRELLAEEDTLNKQIEVIRVGGEMEGEGGRGRDMDGTRTRLPGPQGSPKRRTLIKYENSQFF